MLGDRSPSPPIDIAYSREDPSVELLRFRDSRVPGITDRKAEEAKKKEKIRLTKAALMNLERRVEGLIRVKS